MFSTEWTEYTKPELCCHREHKERRESIVDRQAVASLGTVVNIGFYSEVIFDRMNRIGRMVNELTDGAACSSNVLLCILCG